VRRSLRRSEWDFSDIPPLQRRDATVWEYARESKKLLRAKSLDAFQQSEPAIKWLIQLRESLGIPVDTKFPWATPWIEARAAFMERIKEILKDVPRSPDLVEHFARGPIGMCGIVYEPSIHAAARVLEPGAQPLDGWLLVSINPNAPLSHISEELHAIGIGAQRSYSTEAKECAPLRALSEFRLLCSGKSPAAIVEPCPRLQKANLIRSLKRRIKEKVPDTFKSLFPFLPLPERIEALLKD
jgi:hypothetical protein